MPSGPGALRGFISNTISLISSSLGTEQSLKFSSIVKPSSNKLSSSSRMIGCVDSNRVPNLELMKEPISCLDLIPVPTSISRAQIWLHLLLIIVNAWKNFILSSSSFMHYSCNFYFQIDSSLPQVSRISI